MKQISKFFFEQIHISNIFEIWIQSGVRLKYFKVKNYFLLRYVTSGLNLEKQTKYKILELIFLAVNMSRL